ncbi:hypothetical protein T05_1693 [Trichinella murrelli]|uniref:Uncharacterized protein n=1 Tax=Trichinella murrelli TaxID=144512 RepID=A0A0V0UG31_9BILA|nr:hypothetical protein T05_1693 [Trichinella murrelli]
MAAANQLSQSHHQNATTTTTTTTTATATKEEYHHHHHHHNNYYLFIDIAKFNSSFSKAKVPDNNLNLQFIED